MNKFSQFGGGLATIIALGVIAPILYFRWYIIFGIGMVSILSYTIF